MNAFRVKAAVLALIMVVSTLWVIEYIERQQVIAPTQIQTNQWHYQGETNLLKLPPTDKQALSQHIAKTYRVKPQLATNIVQTVYAYTDSTDFPSPVLVLAVMATESSFRPDVVSTVGALGLMQVKPVHNPGTTIEDNILTGIWVLQKYRMRVDTDVGAIMAYNIGITAFKSGRTNDKYVDKVVGKQLEFAEVLRY